LKIDETGDLVILGAGKLKPMPQDNNYAEILRAYYVKRETTSRHIQKDTAGYKPLSKDILPELWEVVNIEVEKLAMDEDSICERIERNITERFRERDMAVCRVAPILGHISPYAYDSAEDIYGAALKAEGYDISLYPKDTYRCMIDFLLRVRGLT
jgi:hypothetical protein